MIHCPNHIWPICVMPSWSIDLHGKIISLPEKNNFWKSGRIAFIGYILQSYRIFLLPSYQSTFSQKREAYNVLLLSGRASEIKKKVCICIVPNTILKVKIFNAHSAYSYSRTQTFGVKCFPYFFPLTWIWGREENTRHLKRQYGEKVLKFTIYYFFTSPSKLFTNI